MADWLKDPMELFKVDDPAVQLLDDAGFLELCESLGIDVNELDQDDVNELLKNLS